MLWWTTELPKLVILRGKRVPSTAIRGIMSIGRGEGSTRRHRSAGFDASTTLSPPALGPTGSGHLTTNIGCGRARNETRTTGVYRSGR